MPTATPIDNETYRWKVTSDTRGARGEKYFLVNTVEAWRAVSTAATIGLPALGQVYDAAVWPLLVCTGHEAVFAVGRDEGPRVGTTIVRAAYSTPNYGGGDDDDLTPGTVYSVLKAEADNETLKYAVNASAGDTQINGGDGVSRRVGRIVVEVVRVRTFADETSTLMNSIVALQIAQAFNTGAFTLPKFQGGTLQWPIGAEKAQFMGFNRDPKGNAVVHRFTLGLGLTPFYDDYKTTYEGKKEGSFIPRRTHISAANFVVW